MDFLRVAAYNFALIGGTVWLVGWNGWSPWWFLLTVILLASYSRKGEE